MELFIRIENGEPVDHPSFKENINAAFPDIDPYNKESGFARFERVPEPEVRPYEYIAGHKYGWVGRVVKDIWEIKEYPEEEKQQIIERVKMLKPAASWVFNEKQCRWDPPIPHPTGDFNDMRFFWDEQSQLWIEFTE